MNELTKVSIGSLRALGAILMASTGFLGSCSGSGPASDVTATNTDNAAMTGNTGASGQGAAAAGSGAKPGAGGNGATAPSAGTPGTPGTMNSTNSAAGASGSTTAAAGTGTDTAGAAGAAAGSGAAGAGTEQPMTTCMIPDSTDTDPCNAPLKPNDDRLCKMMIGGEEREFYIYASPKYDPCTPASLIMDCHGASESIDVHTGREGFNLSGQMFPGGYGSFFHRAVQEDNAIVVTPAGIGMRWAPATDVPFVNAAADQVEKIAKVNPDHVYITGISMGGMQTVATGCDNANRWRGMAPVAMLTQACSKLDKPTPTISFHAMGDQLTSYADDRATMESIAEHNNCKAGPTDSVSYGGSMSSPDPVCITMSNNVGDPDAPDRFTYPLMPCDGLPETKCVSWTECDDGVEVVFCTVEAGTQPIGGHILYANDSQLALGEVAWRFFKKFWK
jgi:poly(3-hydroxybutyrate) depolymerase